MTLRREQDCATVSSFLAQSARMKFRIGILALSLFLSATTRSFAGAAESDAPASTATATVLVWVRDSRGAPVPGLSAEDFLVSENGVRNRVLAVRNFGPALGVGQGTASTSASKSDPRASAPAPPLDEPGEARLPTQVLLIVTPIGPRGRDESLRDAIRLLKKPVAADWRLGLIDDEGTFIPFGQSSEQMRGILEKLARRVSAPQYQPLFGDKWTPKAARAIRELGVLPGRHVIVCISDYDSKSGESIQQNPTLLRIGPEAFVGEAVNALAAMYTVQGGGPAVAVPFGGAASSSSYTMSGQEVANAMVQDIVKLGAFRSDLLQSADETGGLAAYDLEDAFKRIAGDAAGYYLVTFETQPNSLEGSLHPFSISTRLSHLKIRAPEFYLAPPDPLAGPLAADMKAALDDVRANRTPLCQHQ
jgi:VWFA-related protein